MGTAHAVLAAAKTNDLIARFAARAEPLGVRVERVQTPDAAARVIAALAYEIGTDTLLMSAELAAAMPPLVTALTAAGLERQSPSDPAAIRDAPLGLSLGHLAVAETGSVLLAEPSLPDRAIGLLAATHVILCPTTALVPSLDDAAPILRALAVRPGGAYATLVTGPSRTADIERVLTVGVQGPGRVVILFIDTLAHESSRVARG